MPKESEKLKIFKSLNRIMSFRITCIIYCW